MQWTKKEYSPVKVMFPCLKTRSTAAVDNIKPKRPKKNPASENYISLTNYIGFVA